VEFVNSKRLKPARHERSMAETKEFAQILVRKTEKKME
jgi:hypothetical protein